MKNKKWKTKKQKNEKIKQTFHRRSPKTHHDGSNRYFLESETRIHHQNIVIKGQNTQKREKRDR